MKEVVEVKVNKNLGTIDSNLDAVKASIESYIKDYENYAVSEDTVKDSKKLVSDLRKQQKALDAERMHIKKDWNAPFTEWEKKASLTTDGTFKATDIRTYSGVSLSSLNSSTYKNSGGLFNTATALLINGNALNSQWAQMAIEYNGLYFGIRNDGGNTYFMPGNSNGWYDCYSYVGSDGQWHFANNVYLPGTLQANGLNMPSRTGTQTTAKPNCYIDTNGTFYKTSTASSRSVKDDIKLLESEELNPSRLYDVSIYQFKYKTTYLSNKEDTRYKKDMIGFILENLHEKYPIAVDCHMDEAGKIIYDSWNEQYLIPAMLKLIQDQHNELINQSMKIQNLEIRLLFMNA